MLENYPTNRYDEMLEQLKHDMENGIALAVKGAGLLGKKVVEYLEAYGLKVECVLIDKACYNEQKELLGKKVHIFEDYIGKNVCNLVIAHRGFDASEISEEKKENIVHIYDYDFIGRLVLDDEKDAPITEQYLQSRRSDLEWIYGLLADERSEKALDDYIYQRIYGNYTKEYDDHQYFQDDIVQMDKHEVFVDCGAYHGETILDFISFLREKGIESHDKIIVFEPEPDNVEIMKRRIADVSNVQFEQAGVYSETTTLYMQSGDGSNSAISEKGDAAIAVKSVDDVLDGERATYIKMDVEGSEMPALVGAQNTILKYKPKLAIAVYHKRGDFIDVPRYILNLNPDYKIYFRNHDAAGIELIMYAV